MTVTFKVDVSTQGCLIGVLLNNIGYVSLSSFIIHLKIVAKVVNWIVSIIRPSTNNAGLGNSGRKKKERKNERANE